MKARVLVGLTWVLCVPTAGAQTVAAPPAPGPAAPVAPPAPPGPVVVRDPEWLRKPNYKQLMTVFPVGIRAGGRGAVDCLVTAQGLLHDCRISVDQPAGYGFGAAVLRIAPQYIMKPATRDGKPAEAVTRVSIEFKSNGDVSRGIAEPLIQVLSDVAWSTTPTIADIRAELDKKAGAKSADPDGAILLQCHLDDNSGKPSDCETVYASPGMDDFSGAARSLSTKFQIYLNRGANTRYVRVNLLFRFPDTRSPAFLQRHLRQVSWRRMMDVNRDAEFYPATAVRAGLTSGTAMVDCDVGAAGNFTACDVLRESSPGFGAAARQKIQSATIYPWNDGLPVEGAHVRTTVGLDAPRAAAGGASVVAAAPAPAAAAPVPTPATKP